MPTQTVSISVVSHAIQPAPNGGNIYANANQANQIVEFVSDSPFAIFFKASARMPIRRPKRPFNIAISVNHQSPDESGDEVIASKFKQNKFRAKVNLKQNLPAGAIFWYGIAAYDPPFNIITLDPQIIIQ